MHREPALSERLNVVGSRTQLRHTRIPYRPARPTYDPQRIRALLLDLALPPIGAPARHAAISAPGCERTRRKPEGSMTQRRFHERNEDFTAAHALERSTPASRPSLRARRTKPAFCDRSEERLVLAMLRIAAQAVR
ncbi:hypothetical protein WOLCODRAFT_147147 [Wolfiporia cocos MD-104 SS10]|uniref:Uncharacterized protein n=1 Tax=Wolfiporia cocos (strain MD-104) TaxID=742152 RepID=A0A2H3ISS7_WOLCO|nr:hypothetical protein WOLCODRAFT_147147 [Wolfiporia cocos MD-104 SS10]